MTTWKKLAAIGGALAALALIGGAACTPRYAAEGDTVSVHYTGTQDDGTEFDSSEGGDPIEFTVGATQMIAGFEQAVYGMQVGETKTVTIPPAQGYGLRNENLVVEMDLDEFPGGSATVGQQMQLTFSNGRTAAAVVTEVSEATVTVDANHFLAGKDLTFEIRLVSIR